MCQYPVISTVIQTHFAVFISLITFCHQPRRLRNRHKRMFRKCSLYVAKNIIIISVGYRTNTKKMFIKCFLYVAENIIIILNVGSTTDTRQCSENVLFMSLKTSYHQHWLHNRHKDNVQESKRKETVINCWSNDSCFPFYPLRCRQK